MANDEYGPLAFLIGQWESHGWTGENRAPDPDRQVENTKFRQQTTFQPVGLIENHEQELYALEYKTLAWEEGDDDDPFHQEVGYWIWDSENKQVMKSFIVPRGIAVNAGGTVTDPSKFKLRADVGSEIYGICSNQFLDKEFKSISYDLEIERIDDDTFSYDENTRLQITGQDQVFDHTEKNVMRRVY